eukprot:1144894-Pelagomonas_calceolata.AAC.4
MLHFSHRVISSATGGPNVMPIYTGSRAAAAAAAAFLPETSPPIQCGHPWLSGTTMLSAGSAFPFLLLVPPSAFPLLQLRADLTSSSSIRTAFCMWGSGKPLQPAPLLPPGVSDWLLTYDGSKKAEKGGGGTAGASTAVAGPAAAGAEGKGETATQEGAGAAYRSGKPGGSGMTSGAEGAAETATSVAVAEVATAANEDLRVSTPWMVASHSLYGHHTHCGDPLLTSSHQGGMPQQAQQAQQRSTSQVPAIAKRIQGIAQSTSTALQEQAKAAAPNSAVPSAAAAAAAAATTLQKRAQASASLPAIPNATITEHQLDSSQRAQRQSQLAQQRQDGQPFNGTFIPCITCNQGGATP